jgi:hypothetical protein
LSADQGHVLTRSCHDIWISADEGSNDGCLLIQIVG